MTMIEHPRIGEGNETVLRENMVVSMHPHAITADERACLYMQDTWLVTATGGVPLLRPDPLRKYAGSEAGAGLRAVEDPQRHVRERLAAVAVTSQVSCMYMHVRSSA